MIGHCIEYIEESLQPALLISASTGILHANQAAGPWVADAMQASELEHAGARCATSRKASIHSAADADFLLIPILEPEDAACAVAVAGETLADLPVVLSELHEGTPSFSQIVHVLPQMILTAGPDGTFDYASRRWYATTESTENANRIDGEIRSALMQHSSSFSDIWERGIASNGSFCITLPLTTPSGVRVHKLDAYPWQHGGGPSKWLVSIHDVDEEVQLSHELADARLRLQNLAEIDGELMDISSEPERALRHALLRCEEAFGGTWILSFTLSEMDSIFTSRPTSVSSVERLKRMYRGDGISEHRVGSHDDHVLVMPLSKRDDGDAWLAALWPRERILSVQDAQIFSEIAARLSAALRGYSAFHREHTTARILQTAMLPAVLPSPVCARFSVEYRPARNAALVGGDWYDGFDLPDGRIAYSVGDVAGHGLKSAIVMGHVRDLVRNYCLRGLSPGKALKEINRSVVAMRREYMTALIGVFDPLTLTMEYACAGHPRALLVHRDGSIDALDCSGMMMGIDEDEHYETHTCRVDVDAIVVYTDGLTEFSRDIIEGEQRLRGVLSEWARSGFAGPTCELVDRVLDGSVPQDDVAMMTINFFRPVEMTTSVPSTARDATRARKALERISKDSVVGERANDFVLAMSEAINNAVEHGSNPTDLVEITVHLDASGVFGTVRSSAPWRAERRTNERGRGIMLMKALSDEFRIDVGREGTEVHIAVRPRGFCTTAG